MASTKPELYRVFTDPGDSNTTPEVSGFRDSGDSPSGGSGFQRSVSAVYARAGEDFAEEDRQFAEMLLKDNIDNLPVSNLSRILDTGDYCLDLGKKFNLGEMQLERLEDARYGGENPAKRFIDTLCYVKQHTELSELADIFNNLEMEKASQALQEIVDQSKDKKKETINDLSPLDFSKFYGTLKGGSSYETNWKNVAEELDMTTLIPQIEACRKQGYNYSITTALINTLSARANTVGEFVNVINEVNTDKMGSLNSAVLQLDKELKGMLIFKKKKLERDKQREAEREKERAARRLQRYTVS